MEKYKKELASIKKKHKQMEVLKWHSTIVDGFNKRRINEHEEKSTGNIQLKHRGTKRGYKFRVRSLDGKPMSRMPRGITTEPTYRAKIHMFKLRPSVRVCMLSHCSHVQLFPTLWTVAY